MATVEGRRSGELPQSAAQFVVPCSFLNRTLFFLPPRRFVPFASGWVSRKGISSLVFFFRFRKEASLLRRDPEMVSGDK